MTNKEDAKQFLKNFKEKMRIFQIRFKDREQELQTLLDLEITSNDRIEYIKKLSVENYYKGPKENYNPNTGELWEFGVEVKNKEVYVKISMGMQSKPVICISFHVAEFPISYPFKK